MKSIFLLTPILFLSFNSFEPRSRRTPTYAKNGMVVSASMIASEVGRDILKEGGNAIDAAVATAFALAVTWPEAGNIGNIGGGGFIVYVPKIGMPTTFDFREKAPLAASERMYLDANGKLVQNLNHDGLLSVGVPGTVAGLFDAHKKYGKLSWKKLLNPAVKLAKKGFPFTYALHTSTKGNKMHWEKYPSTIKVMYKDGKDVYEQNEIWKQADLAASPDSGVAGY